MSAMDERQIKELEKIVGREHVLSSAEDLISYSFDGTFTESCPDVVVLPFSTEEVAAVMALADRYETPVIPRGMASGLAGGSVPIGGGIALSLTRMNRLVEIDQDNMTATVEAGVITADLQRAVEALGLFYPPDPSSVKQSTIGGNVACNAGGPRCLKYGVTGDYVQGLTFVTAAGAVIKTGGKFIKNVTGYNLQALLVGSEGTLGIITEIIVRLASKPRIVRTAMAVFNKLDDASRAVNAVLQKGIVPATLEMMDGTSMQCIEEAMHLGLPVDKEAMLIIECDGNHEAAVVQEMQTLAEACRSEGAADVTVAQSESERSELWRARRSVSPSLARKAPNKLGEDISVPRSMIPEAVRRIQQAAERCGLTIAVFGHAGDGNLHPNILFDRRDEEQRKRAEQAADEIFRIALDLQGTLSGEHGIGIMKKPYMEADIGAVSMAFQRGIRTVFDPKGLLNPGKIY
jgi:glycolate oxidase